MAQRLVNTPFGRRAMLSAMVAAAVWAGTGRAQGADARQTIAELYNALNASMRMGGATFPQRFERLAPVIDRVLDLDTILRTSVGLRWNSLDEATRRTLFSVFRTFTIASYTANFDKDGGERFEVLPQTRASGSDTIVQSRLIATGGEPIRLDYVM